MRRRLVARPCCLLCLICALFVACGSGEETEQHTDVAETVEQTGDGTADILIGTPCESVSDCAEKTVCTQSVFCKAGVCEYGYFAAGKACEEGCYVNGVCSADGLCENGELKDCPETDGSICTVPACEPETGECLEEPVEDGSPPYVSSECWDGVICVGGEQDNSEAIPTQLAMECEALNEQLAPFGCVDSHICVGGLEKCKEIFKVDGVQCWTDSGDGGETCVGRSCIDGECMVNHEFDALCGEDDFPDECDGGCLQCTSLACHWIPDPATPDNPSKKVRYCRPGATIGSPCDAVGCMLNQVCAFGAQTDGPMGKETLGVCAGGEEKTKEQCVEELGKPLLDCILAGMGCEEGDGGAGCFLEQEKADKWCWPPEWKCFDKSDTYCTHLDSGENWDPQTGCHTAWVELDCDDQNECTVDACKAAGTEWECLHQPVEGAACDDGDLCTEGGQCVKGVCAGSVPKCDDQDDNPCTDPYCDPTTGECLAPQTDGVPCDDLNACTTQDACQELACVGGPPLSCDDENACNGVETCDNLAGCQPGIALVCNDGNVCNGTETCNPTDGCIAGEGPVCDDGNKCNGYETCDPVLGCVAGVKLNCEDGDVCNGIETCHPVNGCVAGAPLVCNDDNVCTDDFCVPAEGCKIDYNNDSCDDGNASTVDDHCEEGKCVPGSLVDCDDENVCTKDIADPVAGCVYENVGGACDDFDVCTVGDTCAGGQCVSGPEVNCDDAEFCTVDSCHKVNGCVHDKVSDGIPCPGGLNSSCKQGVCTCVPDCDGKECGTDGCSATCGTCQGGTQCVNGTCQEQAFDPSGKYDLVPNVFYTCFMGGVVLDFQTLTFVDNGTTLYVMPSMNGCCSMEGASAKDGAISVSCICPGLGVCDEIYELTGSFTDDKTWEGKLTAEYSGMMCFDCMFQPWDLTGTKK